MPRSTKRESEREARVLTPTGEEGGGGCWEILCNKVEKNIKDHIGLGGRNWLALRNWGLGIETYKYLRSLIGCSILVDNSYKG